MPRVKFTSRNLLRIGDEEILFDPGKMLLSETIAVEKATQLAWPQIIAQLNIGGMTATRAIVWVMRKRHNPRLKLDEVEFNFGDFGLEDPDYNPQYWVLAGPGDDPVIEIPDDTELPAEEVADDNDSDEGGDPKADTTPLPSEG